MKIINKNVYNIMFGMEILKVGEIRDFQDKDLIKMLLAQPNVIEYVAVEDVKNLEEENKKLKEQLAKTIEKPKKEKKVK